MNHSEKEELRLKKFTNIYKTKDFDEIIQSTLEIKSSDISEYEHILLDIVRSGIPEYLSVGMLVSRKIILERLINNDSKAKNELNEYLQKVQVLLRK